MARPISELDFRHDRWLDLFDLHISQVRVVGLGLIGVGLFAFYRLHGLAAIAPHHEPTVAEMLLSLVAVLTGMSGALAAIVGPALFEPYPPAGPGDGDPEP